LAGSPIGLSVVYPGMTNTQFVENSQRQIAKETNAVVDKGSGVGNMLATGMSPAKLAARVVRGITAGEYHIFTHADWKPVIKAVFDDRLAAFGENADPEYRENIEALKARVASTQRSVEAD
jgi:short-subunit dehydrogenase